MYGLHSLYPDLYHPESVPTFYNDNSVGPVHIWLCIGRSYSHSSGVCISVRYTASTSLQSNRFCLYRAECMAYTRYIETCALIKSILYGNDSLLSRGRIGKCTGIDAVCMWHSIGKRWKRSGRSRKSFARPCLTTPPTHCHGIRLFISTLPLPSMSDSEYHSNTSSSESPSETHVAKGPAQQKGFSAADEKILQRNLEAFREAGNNSKRRKELVQQTVDRLVEANDRTYGKRDVDVCVSQ